MSTDDGMGSGIINEQVALAPIAQAESTRSYLLAQTLESTRTVPVVSAKLPVAGDATDEVVGSFTYRGITYAIEPGGESVAVVATDHSKLPQDFLEAQTIVLPSVVFSDGIDSYSVSRIANGAFSSLTKASASVGSEEASVPSDDPTAGASDDGDPSSDGDDDAPLDASDEDGLTFDAADESADLASATDEEPAFGSAIEGSPSAAITAITIPASIISIEDDAFAGSDTLRYLIVSSDNPEYSSYDGCLYDKPMESLLLIPGGRQEGVRVPRVTKEVAEGASSHCAFLPSLLVDADSPVLASADDRAYENRENLPLDILLAEGEHDRVPLDADYSIARSYDAPALIDPLETIGVEPDAGRSAFLVVSSGGLAIDASGCVSANAACADEVALIKRNTTESDFMMVMSLTVCDDEQAARSQDAGEPASLGEFIEDDADAAEVAAVSDASPEMLARIVAVADEEATGSLSIVGGKIELRLMSYAGWFLAGSSGSTDMTVTWTGGTAQAPAAGSIVNVDVTRYEGTLPEAMMEVSLGVAVRSWGASSSKRFIGARCIDTGSYISVDDVFSGEAFSFSFVMPASGCTINSGGFSWSNQYNSRFEPCFEERSDTIHNKFIVQGDARWKSTTTGVTCGLLSSDYDIANYPAVTYSTLGGSVSAPTGSVPVKAGHTFLGWYTEPDGGELLPAVASIENDGKTYYAHWAQTTGSLSVTGGKLELRLKNYAGWFLAGGVGSTDMTISWSGGTAQAPAAGSTVTVDVSRYAGTLPEAMMEVSIGVAVRNGWGGSSSKRFIGARCIDTGSYISVDDVFSGGAFSFTFVMPESNCTINSTGFSWQAGATTRFEPCFEERLDTIHNQFVLDGDARWRSTTTGVTCELLNSGFVIRSYPAVTYSVLGEAVSAPTRSVPVRPGYTFLGWYTDPEGGELMPSIAAIGDDGRCYYAHWAPTTGSLTVTGGYLELRLLSYTGWYLAGGVGSTDMVISWTGGTAQAPAAGSVVTVDVTRYAGTLPEAMMEVSLALSVRNGWGGNASRRFIGARCIDTGSFISIDDVFSGGAFSFTFVMPNSGCTVSPAGFSWQSQRNSRFEPCFEPCSNVIYNEFIIEGDARWKSTTTGVTCSTLYNIAGYPGATYSSIGEAMNAPTHAIPVREGYTFLGWYTQPQGGELMPAVARAEDDGRAYYAHWGNASSTFYYVAKYDNIPDSGRYVQNTNSTAYGFSLGDAQFEHTGHTITSWNTAANGSGTAYAVNRDYDALAAGATLTVYAQWGLDRYALSYDLAGGTWEATTGPDHYDYAFETMVAIPDPVRKGYDFAGWTGTGLDGATIGLEIDAGSNDKLGEHEAGTNLYARSYTATWTPHTYKMSFDLSFDDGSASWKDGEAPEQGSYDAIAYDSSVTFPKAPVRAGWIFTGWAPVEADADKDLYAAEETADPGNFASEQDAVASFEAHWVRNLEVSVPLGSKDVGLSVSADLVEGTEFDVVKGTSEIVNLSDGELKVASVREDATDSDALSIRKANALEAFGGTSSDPSKVEAVSFVLRPTSDGSVPDPSKEEARFPLFGSHAFSTDTWRIPASSGVADETDAPSLRILYDLAFDYSKIAITDLKLNLDAKPISSLVFTVELVDPTEPSYSVGA